MRRTRTDWLRLQALIARGLGRFPRLKHVVRSIFIAWERAAFAPRVGATTAQSWTITRTFQWLPSSHFAESAAAVITSQPHTSRLFAIHRPTIRTLAAAAFEHGAGPDGSCLITELALSRPDGLNGQLDPLAYMAGIFLLERLHDVASKLLRPTDLWIETCTGAEPRDLIALGFAHTGFSRPGPGYHRVDTADPLARLRSARAVVRWPGR